MAELPGAENGALSVAGFGTFTIRIQTINYGFQVISHEEMGPSVKAFYPWQITQAQFAIEVIFPGRVSRDNFNHWMESYMQFAYNPTNPAASVAMRVQGPRNFDFTGIPTTGVEYSTNIQDLTFTETINFEGGSPTNPTVLAAPSTVSSPVTADPSSIYFYPSGTILNGTTEATIYNTSNPIPAAVATFVSPVATALTNFIKGF